MKSMYIIFFKMDNGDEIYYTRENPEKDWKYVIGTSDIDKATLYKGLKTTKDVAERKKKLSQRCKKEGIIFMNGRYGEDYNRVVDVGVKEIKLTVGETITIK